MDLLSVNSSPWGRSALSSTLSLDAGIFEKPKACTSETLIIGNLVPTLLMLALYKNISGSDFLVEIARSNM